MKIGLVCPYNIAKGGGVQEIVRAMQQELAKRGHTAIILTPEPRDMSEYHRKDDIIFVGGAADFKSPLHTTSQFSVAADTYGITQMLEEEKFDILHFHEPWVPMLSRQILSRSKAVNIATFHAKLPETLMTRTMARVVTPYTKAVLKQLHELTAVSEAASEYVRTLTDEPVSIIPNGIDLSLYKNVPHKTVKKEQIKTILYIGRLERRKGVSCLLEAYGLLEERVSDVQLIVAGDGPDREKLENMADDLNIRNITFLGYVTEEEKVTLLAEADLFCAPSLYGESFGIVLLEAMATGVVTVAGNNPGYASVLQELGSLSLVNPKDYEQFARRLDVMLHDEGLRKLWKKWAKAYVQQYHYPKIVDQYIEVYDAATKRHATSLESV
ncbi:MAG TPA: glycosyltransferase family 4 protein [Candidatus Saccharimonadales bacterium]|nr:glycosyltransferase family 4 protein [Candidatus Saccharimonadales bacterium]